MNATDKKDILIASLLGVIPTVWVALLVAPYAAGGLPGIIESAESIFREPLHIEVTDYSGRTVLLFLLLYGMGIGIYLSTRRNYRRGEEHGSAKWGDVRSINRRYAKRNFFENKILTQNVRMNLNGRKHMRNLNTIVIGGSGAGKTRFFRKAEHNAM